MGCCEGRDKEKPSQNKINNKKVKLNGMSAFLLENQDNVAGLDSRTRGKRVLFEQDPASLKLYAEWCRSNKRWEELVAMITYDIKIENPNAYIGWAEKPTTIGSLCVVYLCIECQTDPSKIFPLLDASLLIFFKTIQISSQDFQENSLLLLYYYLDSAGPSSIMKLVKFNVFGVITKFFKSSKEEMQNLTASVCAKIYKNRLYAQQEFLNHNGGFKLVEMLEENMHDRENVEEIIDNLIDLLQDEEGRPVASNLKRINDGKIWEILQELNGNMISTELMEKIDILLLTLSS